MTVAVGHDGVQLPVGQARLIYGQPLADVLGEHQPLVGMGELAPPAVAAQYLLVLLLKRMGVNVVEVLKRTAGHRGRLHTSSIEPFHNLLIVGTNHGSFSIN